MKQIFNMIKDIFYPMSLKELLFSVFFGVVGTILVLVFVYSLAVISVCTVS